MWTDADPVRAELATGGARRLGAAFAADEAHLRVWLELAPAQRRRAGLAGLVDPWVAQGRYADLLTVLDDLLTCPGLPQSVYRKALRAVRSGVTVVR